MHYQKPLELASDMHTGSIAMISLAMQSDVGNRKF